MPAPETASNKTTSAPTAPPLVAYNLRGEAVAIPALDLHCRVVVPDSPDEMEGAELWRLKYAPEKRADGSDGFPAENLTDNLRLDSLSKVSVVYVLCRKPDRGVRKPKMPDIQPIAGKSEDGARLHKKLEPEEYFEQFHLYGPVKVDPDHWDTHASRYSHSLRHESFCNALIPLALPWTTHWIDNTPSNKDKRLPMHLRFIL